MFDTILGSNIEFNMYRVLMAPKIASQQQTVCSHESKYFLSLFNIVIVSEPSQTVIPAKTPKNFSTCRVYMRALQTFMHAHFIYLFIYILDG